MEFQAYDDLSLRPKIPVVGKITFTAQWDVKVDMDLLVFFRYRDNDFCLVGSKASHECGLVSAGHDS